MAGKQIGHVSQAITASGTLGKLTVADVTGFYKNAIVWINDSTKADAKTKRAVIRDIDTTGKTISVLFRSDAPGEAPAYGYSNVTAPVDYNGGTITQHGQFIYNSDDAPLS